MRQKKGSMSVDTFTEEKLKLVDNVLLCYNFLYKDDEDTLIEELIQLVKGDFRKWKSRGYPLSTDAYDAL